MAMFPPPDELPPAVRVAWSEESKDNFCDSRLLHSKYWQRYNAITIPLQSPAEFYADALAAARDSLTARELEITLEKRSQQRRQEIEQSLKSVLEKAALETKAGQVTREASTHGSLSSFAKALVGLVYGWDTVDTGNVLNFDYLLPEDHWQRTGDSDDVPFTQVDPFHDMAGPAPHSDDEEDWFTDPEPERVVECLGTAHSALEYASRTDVQAIGELRSAAAPDAPSSDGAQGGHSGEASSLPKVQGIAKAPPIEGHNSNPVLDEKRRSSEREHTPSTDDPPALGRPAASSSLDSAPRSPFSASSPIAISATNSAIIGSRGLHLAETESAVEIAPDAGDLEVLQDISRDKGDTAAAVSPKTPLHARKRRLTGLGDESDAGSRYSKRRC